jgi:hypothetical protein
MESGLSLSAVRQDGQEFPVDGSPDTRFCQTRIPAGKSDLPNDPYSQLSKAMRSFPPAKNSDSTAKISCALAAGRIPLGLEERATARRKVKSELSA